jgi:hypothetical protein
MRFSKFLGKIFRLKERYAACWLEMARGKSLDHLQLGRRRLRLGEVAKYLSPDIS